MKFPLNAFTDAIETILRDPEKKTVTVFVPPKQDCQFRIRVTRIRKHSDRSRCNELKLTYGKPNYEEREFLKLCKQAKCNPKRMRFSFFKK